MKIKKIILMLLIFILCVCVVNVTATAGTDVSSLFGGELQNIGQGETGDNGITNAIDSIIGLIQIAGTGVALIAVSLLGIKYMLASGEEKAEIKKYMVGAVVGGILVFGGTKIAQILADFSTGIFA